MSQWPSLLESPCEVALLRVGLALSEKRDSHCRSDRVWSLPGSLQPLGEAGLPGRSQPKTGPSSRHRALR